jgi:hypothetical protein
MQIVPCSNANMSRYVMSMAHHDHCIRHQACGMASIHPDCSSNRLQIQAWQQMGGQMCFASWHQDMMNSHQRTQSRHGTQGTAACKAQQHARHSKAAKTPPATTAGSQSCFCVGRSLRMLLEEASAGCWCMWCAHVKVSD